MAHPVTLILGDGPGPELAEATRRVLEATGVEFDWDVQEAGTDVMGQNDGNPLPEHVVESIRRNGTALKGPTTTRVGTGARLRAALDLYGRVQPCKSYPGARSVHANVDLVVVRESTEDLFSGVEFQEGTEDADELLDWLVTKGHNGIRRDSGLSVRPISETATRRIVELAFDYARRNGRRKVTAVHNGNVFEHTDGLFLHVAQDVAAESTDIEFDDRIVDDLALQLVQRPDEYDVLVLPNLYGDIVSGLCAGLIGGLGLAPGAGFGTEVAIFEPAQGSAPDDVGRNRVNPMATMLSGVMMLRHLDEVDAAERLERAIADVIDEGESVTYDMKPGRDDPTAVGTSEVADAITEKLEVLV